MSLLTNLFRLIPPSFRAGYCPSSLQQLANDLISGTQVTFLVQQGNFLYNYGDATPTADNRIFPWLRPLDGRWYTFQFGLWVSPNPRPPDGEWIVWPKSETLLWSYDGGDGIDPAVTSPTAFSGAMWQLVPEMKGRFPLGAGDVPVVTPTLTVSLGDTGGEGQHTLTNPEMPYHGHNMPASTTGTAFDGPWSIVLTGVPGGTWRTPSDNPDHGFNKFEWDGGDPTTHDTTPHNNLPPYYGVNWAKRTGRLFYALPA